MTQDRRFRLSGGSVEEKSPCSATVSGSEPPARCTPGGAGGMLQRGTELTLQIPGSPLRGFAQKLRIQSDVKRLLAVPRPRIRIIGERNGGRRPKGDSWHLAIRKTAPR